MARRRKVTSKPGRGTNHDAETLPAPSGSALPPPLSVPGLRDLAASFAETIAPPPGADTIPPSAPPATIPGARMAATMFVETLVPPELEGQRVESTPPESGDAGRADGVRPAKSA